MPLPIVAPLAGFFMGLAPVAVRAILINLGIGLITYTGITTIVDSLISSARTHYQGMAADIVQLAALGGISEAFGIIVAAIVIRVSISFMPKLGVLPQ